MRFFNPVSRQVVTGLLLVAASAARGGESTESLLDWDTAILGQKFAPQLQFTADYTDRFGTQHQLKYWREQQSKLRRQTDDKVDLMVERDKSGGAKYYVIDHQKKILTTIKQENLYRIGTFTSWDDLVHILAKPSSAFQLHGLDRKPARIAGQQCSWLRLSTAAAPDQNICWSKQLGIPLVMTINSADSTKEIWRVRSLLTKRPVSTDWTVNVNGYGRIDANQDIDPASD